MIEALDTWRAEPTEAHRDGLGGALTRLLETGQIQHRVLVVDDHEVVREGLVAMLG